MKKKSIRLQPRFQLHDNAGTDETIGEVDGVDDYSMNTVINTLWKKRNRKRQRRNAEKRIFLKTLSIARVLLFLLSVMLIVRYQNTMDKNIDGGSTSLAIAEGKYTDKKARIYDEDEDEIEIISRHAKKPLHYSEPMPSLQIPSAFNDFYANLSSSSSLRQQPAIVPVFWHILKSGGTSVKDLYGICLQKVEAAGLSIAEENLNQINNEILQVHQLAEGGIRRVNVDTSTGAGIVRAKNMNLVPSRLADIIFTPLLHEAAQLFNNEGVPQQKGMIFCLIRHPLERAVSLFHYLQKATWEPTYNEEIKNIKTVEDYAIR